MRYSEMKARENSRDWEQARSLAEIVPQRRIPWVLVLLAGTLLLALAACASPQYRDTSVAITTEGPVDLTRYQGLWYEIARFPNRFEEGCAGVTAEYTLNADGTIRVLNTCRQGSIDGPVSTAEGVAKSTNEDNDRLVVSFVPWLPFAKGDYWILDIDDAYEVAVIGTPSGSVGWVLARTPSLPSARLLAAYDVLQRNGYDINLIMQTDQ
ncbi:MAG: lipocalin family protein [Paracoccaceae bacterium]